VRAKPAGAPARWTTSRRCSPRHEGPRAGSGCCGDARRLANKKVGVKEITALDGYFSGPDAYYQELVYLPARETMADEGVSDVAVPTSTYYLTWKALDPATVTLALESVGKSSKLSGIHGVALIDVTANVPRPQTRRGRTATSPRPTFLLVQVQNQAA
jgi:hypothetical protein